MKRSVWCTPFIRASPLSAHVTTTSTQLPLFADASSSFRATRSHLTLHHGALPLHRPRIALFHSSVQARADIFEQTFEQVEETIQKETKKDEKTEETKKVIEVSYKQQNLPFGRKRLDPLLRQIRGLSYKEAIVQLQFCPLRSAPQVKEVIEACRQRADKKGLNPERLLLSSIFLTKGVYGPKRMECKAKGRVGLRQKQKSHLNVSLKEIPYVDGEKQLGKFARGVNKARRQLWQTRLTEASQALNIHPLYVTVRDVKKYEWEKEKKAKLAKKVTAAAATAAATSGASAVNA